MRLYQITEADVDTSTGEVHRWHDRYRLLQKYSGDPSVFVHFSDVNKLGINPGSGFSTPIGVYGYPVDYVLDPPRGTGTPFNVPFAGNRQYAHVFRVRDLDRCLVVSDDSGNSGDHLLIGVINFIDRSFYKIVTRSGMGHLIHSVSELYDYIINNADINIPSYLPKFPDEDKIRRVVGDDLGRTKLAAVCLVMRLIGDSATLKDLASATQSPIAFHSGDTILLWCFTMAAASIRSSQIRRSSGLKSKSSVVWSAIMRDLGVSGVIDRGFGLIHPNEPTQAVFFDVRDLIHLDVIRNTYLSGGFGASNNSELYNVAVFARHGDFRAINTFISDEDIFVDWIRHTIKNIDDSIPDEFMKGIIGNKTGDGYTNEDVRSQYWLYLHKLAMTFRSVIKMDTKRLIVCKKNGGDRYLRIRPVVARSVNDGVKLIRDYFDDIKAWLDRNANGQHSTLLNWTEDDEDHSSSGSDDWHVRLDDVKVNLDALYKAIAILERSI